MNKNFPSSPQEQPHRFHYLDGCRGVAALFVANFHWLCAFAPQAIAEYSDHPWALSDTPLAIVYNGGFAVSIFFVLSGFVIANSASKRHLPLLFNLAQRYARLALPVLASFLFALVMLTIFNDTAHELKAIIPSRWLDFVYDGDIPGFFHAIYDGLGGVFIHGGSLYNNVLWTMQIEMLGSWLVYVIYAVCGRRVVLAEALILAMLLAMKYFDFVAFMAGALLREGATAGRLPVFAPRLMLLLGGWLGSMMKGYGERMLAGIMHNKLVDFFAKHQSFALGEPHGFWHLIGAILVIYGFLALPSVQHVFSAKPFRFLGKISFGFYLVHVVLIYTVVGRLFLATSPVTDHLPFIYVTFLSLSLTVGYLFTLIVDQPVMRGIHKAQTLLKPAANQTIR